MLDDCYWLLDFDIYSFWLQILQFHCFFFGLKFFDHLLLEVLIVVRCANELLRNLGAILFGCSYKCSIWRRHVSPTYLCEIRWSCIILLFFSCETQMKLNFWLRGLFLQFQSTYGKPLLAAKDAKCSSKDAEAGVLAMEALHKQVNLALCKSCVWTLGMH